MPGRRGANSVAEIIYCECGSPTSVPRSRPMSTRARCAVRCCRSRRKSQSEGPRDLRVRTRSAGSVAEQRRRSVSGEESRNQEFASVGGSVSRSRAVVVRINSNLTACRGASIDSTPACRCSPGSPSQLGSALPIDLEATISALAGWSAACIGTSAAQVPGAMRHIAA